ncbi:hypothetical protein BDN72DRAFT_855372, partial [Pluteus cervinus]
MLKRSTKLVIEVARQTTYRNIDNTLESLVSKTQQPYTAVDGRYDTGATALCHTEAGPPHGTVTVPVQYGRMPVPTGSSDESAQLTVMGRHRKYNSPGEKKAANRLKSRRSYWRNQDEINTKRRSHYHDKVRSTTTVIGTNKTEAEWRVISTINELKTRFERYVGHSRHNFVHSKYQQALEDASTLLLSKTLSCLEDFLGRAQRVEDEIYELDGASEDWRTAHALTTSVRTITQALEEVTCAFLVGLEYTTQVFGSRGFQYQNW